jgi:hypothetical protein
MQLVVMALVWREAQELRGTGVAVGTCRGNKGVALDAIVSQAVPRPHLQARTDCKEQA